MWRAALIFVLLTALPAQAATATAAVIAEVQAALDKGQAQQAARLADTALKEGAVERGRLMFYRGLAEELMGRNGDAMVDFSNALADRGLPGEEREEAQLQRGFLRDGLGELDTAADDYSAVIALHGKSLATAYTNRANIFRRRGRLAEARRDYLAALSAGSLHPQYAWFGLGQIAEAQHDTTGARGDYTRAVAAAPGYSDASDRLAALGGAPEGQIVEAPVLLHPPARQPAPVAHVLPKVQAVVHRAPAPAPAPAKTAAAALRPALDETRHGGSGGEVQLGAWRSEAEARSAWAQAKGRAGPALQGLSPVVEVADLPGRGRYYRLRTVPAAGQSRAALCDALTSKGLACFPARD